jgi:hypothetical protein
MFSLIVPYKRNGDYGINAILFLKAWSPTVVIFVPSIRISPDSNSQRRKRVYKIDDFPAPVLPTIPTFIFGWITIERSLTLGSRVFLYLIVTFLNSIFPMSGQDYPGD